jgi:hypothetical protein
MITFSTVAIESGTLEFMWKGDNDYASSTTSKITVT